MFLWATILMIFSVFNMLNEKGGFNLSFGGFRDSYGEFDGEHLYAALISSTLVGEAENKKRYIYAVEFQPKFGDLMYWPERTEGFEHNGYLDLMLTDMKKDKFWRFFDLELELKDGRISSESSYVRCIKD